MASVSANRLLALLPDHDRESLASLLEVVPLAPDAVLQNAGDEIGFVHFPLSGRVLLTTVLEDGSEINACGVGCGGALSSDPDADAECAPCKLVVALPGEALRLPFPVWREWLAAHAYARFLFTQYADLLAEHARHGMACQIKHDVESRLCQELLHMQESRGDDPIPITHAALSRAMGVRRTTITLVARALQDAGIICYRRGMVSIVDPYALHQSSCECYRAACSRNHAFHARMLARREDGTPGSRKGASGQFHAEAIVQPG